MPEVGAYGTETLTVSPADTDTAVMVIVTAPDETATSPAVTPNTDKSVWTAVVHYDQPGVWRLAWAVTGTGAGVKSMSVDVDPLYALPTWAPDRMRVADYIPRRTLRTGAGQPGAAALTFNDETRPTGAEVDRLIVDACAWVTVVTGPVDESLWKMATATAAVWTAAVIERDYPTRQGDVSTADLLMQQATQMRTDLQRANEVITGDDPDDPAAHILPVWSFPRPVDWGDEDDALG
jgi:hypothetical protein